MDRDLKTIIKPVNAMDLTVVAGAAVVVGEIIDTLGYQGIAFVPRIDNYLDGLFTPLVEDGDNAALADAAAVSDTFLIGTEAMCGAYLSDYGISSIGYVGKKRYVRLTLIATLDPTGDVSADAILGYALHEPTPEV